MEIIKDNSIRYNETDTSGDGYKKLLNNLYGSNLDYPNRKPSDDSVFKKLEESEDDDCTIVFKKDGTISFVKIDNPKGTNDKKGVAKLNDEEVLFITKKQLKEYQQTKTNNILQIKNKNGKGFYYIKAEELIKSINDKEGEINCSNGDKISISDIDINDAKEVLKTFSQLIETKSHYNKNNKNGTDKIEKKEYLSRICMTGTVPVFHKWKSKKIKNKWRSTDHELLSEKREQYVITYPAWPNFEGSEEEVAEQWKILGVEDDLNTIYDNLKSENYKEANCYICYKNYIRNVLELQIQTIKFDGINQLSVTFPSAFLNGIKDETAKERLLDAFGEAVEEVAGAHKEIEFFATNSGKYNFKDTNKNICLTKGVDAAELNSTKYKIKDSDSNYIEKTINVAYNVTPHDLTEVGNGCFGNSASTAGDERFARNAPLVVAIMGCSKNNKYKELQELAEKAVEKIEIVDKPKKKQKPEKSTTEEDNQTVKLQQQIEDYKTEYEKAKAEINNSTDLKEKKLMDNKIKAKSDFVEKVEKKGDQYDIYAQSLEYREEKILLNKAINEIATQKIKKEKKEVNVLVDNFTNALENQNYTSNKDVDASINSFIAPIRNDKKVVNDILNNEKFKKTVLKPITVKVGDEEKTYDGYGAIMSYDGQKMKIKFKKDGFIVEQLKRMFPNDDKYKEAINILENGEILFNDNLSQSEFLEFATKFKHNPINAYLELCANKGNNVSYTLNGETKTLKNELGKEVKETLNIAVECRKTMAELLDYSETLNKNGPYKDFNEFVKDYALNILANPNSNKSKEIIDNKEITVNNPVYVGKQLLKILKVVNTPDDERKEKDKQLFNEIKEHIDGELTINKLALFINESHSINLENAKKKMKNRGLGENISSESVNL